MRYGCGQAYACLAAPPVNADNARNDGRGRKGLQRLERQDEPCSGATVEGVAAVYFYDGCGVVSRFAGDAPPFAADPYGISGAKLRTQHARRGADAVPPLERRNRSECDAEDAESAIVGPAMDRDPLHVLAVAKPRHRGSKVRLRSIPEFDDERVPFEGLLHDAALHPSASSMNQADLAQPAVPCGGDVLFDNGLDVAGSEGVEVEGVLDGNSHVNSQSPTPNSQVA